LNITFNELVLRNFKSHKAITIVFNPITRIYGTNGAGKSSVGEAITWCLYGVDTLGNTLIKALSPEPTNYDYDCVEAHVLMTVDGKEIRISRMIEDGNLLYFINDTPKKATAFKEVVESLFDKTLFLSLFNPLYFFTQKWEEQRSQLLKYVPQPTNKEVFAGLEKLHVDKLEPLLEKKSIADLEAQHKDNKNRKDKDVLFLSGQVKAIRDDYNQAPEADPDAVEKLKTELALIETQLQVEEEKKIESISSQNAFNRLNEQLKAVKIKADNIKESYSRV
jgi:DNA repair exonuclease SbcCD ATPase subunit